MTTREILRVIRYLDPNATLEVTLADSEFYIQSGIKISDGWLLHSTPCFSASADGCLELWWKTCATDLALGKHLCAPDGRRVRWHLGWQDVAVSGDERT